MVTMNCSFICTITCILFICKLYLAKTDISLTEESSPNQSIFDLKSLVANRKMIYNLITSYNGHSYFTIKNDNLYINKLIDLDTMCEKVSQCCNKEKETCVFSIGIAVQESSETSPTLRELIITIQDKNDNFPVFKDKSSEIELSESLNSGYKIRLPTATDNDFGINRIDKYALGRKEPKSFDQYFQLSISKHAIPVKVELQLIKSLDRETVNKFSFELLAIDGGYRDQKTGSTNIVIKVKDENDNMPQFTKSLYKETVKEGVITSYPIMKLVANDPDEMLNGKILYKFDPNNKNDIKIRDNFTIKEDTGEIFLKQALDYEKQHSFKFIVIATNPTTAATMQLPTASATVEITVENVYDERLDITVDYFTSKNYSSIEENKNNVFIAIITVKSKEADNFRSSINCNLESFGDYLNLISKADDIYIYKTYEVRNIVEIDRETLPKIETNIICKDTIDPSVLHSTAPLKVIIKDQNDNAPLLEIIGDKSVREHAALNTMVLTIKAVDKDEGENGRVSFSLEKSSHQTLEYLKIDEDGVIRVKYFIDCEGMSGHLTTLPVTVTASDHGEKPKSTDLIFNIDVIDINDNSPKFILNPMVFSVPENMPRDFNIGDIEVEDKDVKDVINAELTNTNPGSLFPFYIARKSNRLFALNTSRPLDREKENKYTFNVIASDEPGRRGHTITGSIEVYVNDVNDNPPIILFPSQNNNTVQIISYKEPENYKLLTVAANDQDQSKEFNDFHFLLESSTDIFDIDRHEGYIFTRRLMTYSDVGDHTVKLTVRNTAPPMLKSSVNINIVIDNSPPKSSSTRTENSNPDGRGGFLSNGASGNFDIMNFIYILCSCIVLTIIVIFVILALRCFKKEPVCLRTMLNKCFLSGNSPLDSDTNLKANIKKDLEIYKNQNQQLTEKSLIFREADTWNPSNNLVENYNTSPNINAYSKTTAYNKLSNSSQYYFQPHQYQTIEDDHVMTKFPDINMNKVGFSLPNRGKFDTNCKSEINLNTENLFYNHNQELSQINEPNRMKWISSFTPIPVRSKSVVNRVIPNEQTENNFAVLYPYEQSTFV